MPRRRPIANRAQGCASERFEGFEFERADDLAIAGQPSGRARTFARPARSLRARLVERAWWRLDSRQDCTHKALDQFDTTARSASARKGLARKGTLALMASTWFVGNAILPGPSCNKR